MVFAVGLINLFFLVEYPSQVGINIEENGILNEIENGEDNQSEEVRFST